MLPADPRPMFLLHVHKPNLSQSFRFRNCGIIAIWTKWWIFCRWKFRLHFLECKLHYCILIIFLLKFVPMGSIDKFTLVQVIVWHHKGNHSLPELVLIHYNDVIMGAMASQITSLTTVYSTVYSGADQRKHQSSASLAFVWGNHRKPVKSPHKWPVTRKMFPFDDVIMPKLSLAVGPLGHPFLPCGAPCCPHEFLWWHLEACVNHVLFSHVRITYRGICRYWLLQCDTVIIRSKILTKGTRSLPVSARYGVSFLSVNSWITCFDCPTQPIPCLLVRAPASMVLAV